MNQDALTAHRRQDEAARALISEALRETLFVEAGAGTGKTRALVDRYVALVLGGHPVEALVAITFTEKAAAELRDRVRAELEARRRNGPGDPLVVERALNSLGRAQISTIHAFCLNALHAFAPEVGIDPSFGIQDEVAAQRRFEERWSAFLEDLAARPEERRAVNRVLELGMWPSDLEKLARALWGNVALAQTLAAAPPAVGPARVPDFEGLAKDLLETGFERVPTGDNLKADVSRLFNALLQLIEVPAEEREALLITLLPTLNVGGHGRQDNWGGKARIEAARSTARAVRDELRDSLVALKSEALSRLLPSLVRFAIDDAGERARGGNLVFDDLILNLRNVLRASPEARRRLRARYAVMLIDEFQDTDPLQTDIALDFAVDPDTGVLEPGRLFLVGDPKQSIYRFRRADMAVYSQTLSTVRDAGGRLPRLALNRRSRWQVIDFVNGIFAGLIGDGANPAVQPAYQPIHAERDVELAGPNVGCLGWAVDGPARDVRRIEAGQLAAYCRAALEQGWQVCERDGRVRRAEYRDIAILVPTRNLLQPLERSLTAAAVPYRVEGGSLVYGTQEVRDLINCLAAIDDPTDEIAVVAALRSPAYACSDVELAEYRLERGSFNYLWPELDQRTGRVAEALLSLRDYHRRSHEGSLAALVESFVAERRLVEAGLYASADRNAFRRARFVIEQARGFEAERPESLRSFVDWLEGRSGEAILDHEGAGLDDDEDAVRILTVHAAKGLEFPIVFLAGLGIRPASGQTILMADRITGEVGISAGPQARRFTMGPIQNISQQEQAHLDAERDRLLYVAATRARDHLIVSLFYSQRASGTSAHRLLEAGAGMLAQQLPQLPEVDAGVRVPFAGLEPEPLPASEEEFLSQRAAVVRGARREIVTSATALGALLADTPADEQPEQGDAEQEREDESEPWARGRAGTHRGRAVHAALQVLPWDADEATIEALAQAQAVAETVPEQAQTVAELLRRALATDAAARARNAGRALREVPFALVEDGVTAEGFVDLVLEGPGGEIEVIDWKTDAVAPGEVPRRLESYRLQAGLYVLGIEAATGRRVGRVTYVFVTPGVEASPGEPAELAAYAREQIARHPDRILPS